ncbi:hypothetical protein CMI37_29340 [Candidatus Pacearchaeota archaeon]|nr:hypothetical protein [Candidatus Pacearchaeota archaeon]|tara:strand:+ start:581 stop:1594 length:1014 start_codon:yes stop_codon:yes gene_type:complete
MNCKYCGEGFELKNRPFQVFCTTRCKSRHYAIKDKSTKECVICGLAFKSVLHHLKTHNIDAKTYWEKYFPNFCVSCEQLIEYSHNRYSKLKFCSRDCASKHTKRKKRYEKDYLLNILKEIHLKYGGAVTQKSIATDGRVAASTYYSHFNSFSEACEIAEVPHQAPIKPHKFEEPVDTLLTVLIDSREKIPYKFKAWKKVTLKEGDYCLEEINTGVVIERKSIMDLKGCILGKRFQNEINRVRKKKGYVVILVDGTVQMFMKGAVYGKLSSKALFHFVKKFESENADVCQFLFTGGREQSAELVYHFCILTPDVLKGVDLQELYGNDELMDYYYGKPT